MLADHCIVRCTARPEDLDGEGGRRSREHTELLVHELELGVLWDEYGLVGDIVVSSAFFPIPFYLPLGDVLWRPLASMGTSCCRLSTLLEMSAANLLTQVIQPFTNDFPRADIHELIAPDILHQLIKGSFKDHLVAWIQEYLTITHGAARGNEVLDDIDRR